MCFASATDVGPATKKRFAVNFTKAYQLEIEIARGRVSEFVGAMPSTVRLVTRGGPLHFQFDMLPEQARAMAAELLAVADELEAAPTGGAAA